MYFLFVRTLIHVHSYWLVLVKQQQKTTEWPKVPTSINHHSSWNYEFQNYQQSTNWYVEWTTIKWSAVELICSPCGLVDEWSKQNLSEKRYYLSRVSWPSGLVHRTQVLVLSENQNVGSISGSDTCVLEQDT